MASISLSENVSREAERQRRCCVECLREFAAHEMIEFREGAVCAECKAVVLAKIESGRPVGSLWRRGRLLVIVRNVEKRVVLPPCCISCNAALEDRQMQEGRLTAPCMWLVVLHAAPLMVVVAPLMIRWRFGRCDQHRRRVWLAFWAQLALTVMGLGVAIFSFQTSHFVVMLVGFLMWAVGYAVAVFAGGDLREWWRTPTHCYVGGFGRAFLEQFPEWPGRR